MILGNEAIPKELSNQGSFANLSKTFYKERFPLSEYIRQKPNILTKPNVLTLNTQKCGCLPTQITSSRPRLKMNIPTQERCLVKMPLLDFITLQLRYLTSRKGVCNNWTLKRWSLTNLRCTKHDKCVLLRFNIRHRWVSAPTLCTYWTRRAAASFKALWSRRPLERPRAYVARWVTFHELKTATENE